VLSCTQISNGADTHKRGKAAEMRRDTMTANTNNATLTYYANTIKEQIGAPALFAVDARDFEALPETETQCGGLSFTIGSRSRSRSKKIVVRLTWLDVYSVELVNIDTRTNKESVRQLHDCVFCDALESLVYDLSLIG